MHTDVNDKDGVSLEEYLANENEHEMIRENVLSLTMSFDKRVHSFLKRIVCAESNPMKVKHRHYRVEFQLRGAGHIHGVLWADLNVLEKTLINFFYLKFKECDKHAFLVNVIKLDTKKLFP